MDIDERARKTGLDLRQVCRRLLVAVVAIAAYMASLYAFAVTSAFPMTGGSTRTALLFFFIPYLWWLPFAFWILRAAVPPLRRCPALRSGLWAATYAPGILGGYGMCLIPAWVSVLQTALHWSEMAHWLAMTAGVPFAVLWAGSYLFTAYRSRPR